MSVGLTVHLLRVECRTTAPLALPEFTGSALRGALLGALRPMFCPDGGRADCAPCPHAGVCPISRLIATVDRQASRGEEAPRPYVLRPVVAAARRLEPNEPFSFGLSLVGSAAAAFPYLLQGLLAMGERGFGLRQRAPGTFAPGTFAPGTFAPGTFAPGTFAIERLVAANPFIAAEQVVYERGRATVYAPALGVNQGQISAYVSALPAGRLGLELRSPLRLVSGGSLLHRPSMGAIMRRLLRRLSDLCTHFASEPFEADFAALLTTADAVRVVEDATEWLDLESYSGRTGKRTPIGGLLGRFWVEGELAPLLPYLGWLPAVGLGKDVTKGNGWIELAGQSAVGSREEIVWTSRARKPI